MKTPEPEPENNTLPVPSPVATPSEPESVVEVVEIEPVENEVENEPVEALVLPDPFPDSEPETDRGSSGVVSSTICHPYLVYSVQSLSCY